MIQGDWIKITASCGHKVASFDELEAQSLADYDRDGNHCVFYGSYCKSCAEKNRTDGSVLHGAGEENKWMGGSQ